MHKLLCPIDVAKCCYSILLCRIFLHMTRRRRGFLPKLQQHDSHTTANLFSKFSHNGYNHFPVILLKATNIVTKSQTVVTKASPSCCWGEIKSILDDRQLLSHTHPYIYNVCKKIRLVLILNILYSCKSTAMRYPDDLSY